MKPITYILGARCKDGVVLVGDRKVTGGDASEEPPTYEEKITCLNFPKYAKIVFAGSGLGFVFKEFLEELPRRVARSIELFKEENDKHPNMHYNYKDYNFRTDCIALLKEMEMKYSKYAEVYYYQYSALILDVGFVQNVKTKENDTTKWTLYQTNLPKCVIFPRDKKIELGLNRFGDVFLKSWSRKDSTMRDTARLGSFIIKYIEKEKLADVGVGKQQPQIWLFEDGKNEPREIVGSELKKMLNGIDEEVEKKRHEIGSLSTFLRL